MDNSKKYYLFLEGFRGIAVLWIIIHHIFIFIDLQLILGPLYVPFSKFADVGVFGVDIFFVISGFLITGLLLEDLDNGKIKVKRFYGRRFLKIIPQYILTLVVGLILMLVYRHNQAFGQDESYNPFHKMWINFLFLQNYFLSSQLPPLAHLWTIAVEWQFYCLYPLLLMFICKLLNKSHERRVLLLVISVVLIIIGNMGRYSAISALLKFGGRFDFQSTHFHFDGLVFGILIKLIEPYLRKIIGILKQVLSFVCLIGAVVIYLIFLLNGIHYESWSVLGLAYLAPGLLIISALINGRGFIHWAAENQFLRWVGRNSYATYLWHYILIYFFVINFRQPVSLNVVMAYFVLSLFLGFLSTFTIEKYFLNFRKVFDKAL